jgi:hypothetical protein
MMHARSNCLPGRFPVAEDALHHADADVLPAPAEAVALQSSGSSC